MYKCLKSRKQVALIQFAEYHTEVIGGFLQLLGGKNVDIYAKYHQLLRHSKINKIWQILQDACRRVRI